MHPVAHIPPGVATSSYGIPRSWLIGAGISDYRPPRGTPSYPCSPLTPPRSQSCAAQVVGEMVADTSDGE